MTAEAPERHAEIVVRDPDDIPVRIVDAIPFCGLIGNNIGLILTSNQGRIDEEGKAANDHVIAARLRLDLNMTKLLIKMLETQVDMLTAPSDLKAN